MKEEELEHVSRLATLEGLVTGLSHEISQPLTAIMVLCEAARQGISALPMKGTDADRLDIGLRETADLMAKASQQATRAGEIIRRLKRLARKSAPHRQLSKLNELIREVLPLLEPEARRLKCAIRLALADELPACLCDQIQIQQVILNLVRNALESIAEAAPPDPEREIVVKTWAASNSVTAEIVDRGAGLSGCDQQRLFQAFYTTKPAGGGMGLSISRTIIEAHGGTIWAKQNPGERGATFGFSLPLKESMHEN
jgi:two-component system sensor kinase FixL